MKEQSQKYMLTAQKKFITSLLILSSSLPMKTRADELDKIPKPDKVLVLNIGVRAPYSGVLMDEDQFRYFKTVELESEMYANKLKNSGPSFSDYIWVAAGFFVGGLAVGALAK